MSPIVVAALSLTGLLLVADYVPDGTAADSIDYALWAVGLVGFCGCGLGWLLSGRRFVGIALFLVRTSLVLVGGGIVGLSFTILCGNPCDEAFQSDIPGPVVALAVLLFVVSTFMPFISSLILAVALPTTHQSVPEAEPKAPMSTR